jgi:hypothetical protein
VEHGVRQRDMMREGRASLIRRTKKTQPTGVAVLVIARAGTGIAFALHR